MGLRSGRTPTIRERQRQLITATLSLRRQPTKVRVEVQVRDETQGISQPDVVVLSPFVWHRLGGIVSGTRVLPRRYVGLQEITVTVQASPVFQKEWADLCKASPFR